MSEIKTPEVIITDWIEKNFDTLQYIEYDENLKETGTRFNREFVENCIRGIFPDLKKALKVTCDASLQQENESMAKVLRFIDKKLSEEHGFRENGTIRSKIKSAPSSWQKKGDSNG